jgi:hypothetical protein
MYYAILVHSIEFISSSFGICDAGKQTCLCSLELFLDLHSSYALFTCGRRFLLSFLARVLLAGAMISNEEKKQFFIEFKKLKARISLPE